MLYIELIHVIKIIHNISPPPPHTHTLVQEPLPRGSFSLQRLVDPSLFLILMLNLSDLSPSVEMTCLITPQAQEPPPQGVIKFKLLITLSWSSSLYSQFC